MTVTWLCHDCDMLKICCSACCCNMESYHNTSITLYNNIMYHCQYILYFLMKLSINYMFRNWHPHGEITHQNRFIAALFWITEYICKGLKSTSGQRFHFVYYHNNVRGRTEEGNRNWNVEQNCASVNSFFSKCIKSAARIFTGPYMKSKHD